MLRRENFADSKPGAVPKSNLGFPVAKECLMGTIDLLEFGLSRTWISQEMKGAT